MHRSKGVCKGAGKTTLIKILTGQLAVDKGSVVVFDKDIS